MRFDPIIWNNIYIFNTHTNTYLRMRWWYIKWYVIRAILVYISRAHLAHRTSNIGMVFGILGTRVVMFHSHRWKKKRESPPNERQWWWFSFSMDNEWHGRDCLRFPHLCLYIFGQIFFGLHISSILRTLHTTPHMRPLWMYIVGSYTVNRRTIRIPASSTYIHFFFLSLYIV